jgi:hypothetical protein
MAHGVIALAAGNVISIEGPAPKERIVIQQRTSVEQIRER